MIVPELLISAEVTPTASGTAERIRPPSSRMPVACAVPVPSRRRRVPWATTSMSPELETIPTISFARRRMPTAIASSPPLAEASIVPVLLTTPSMLEAARGTARASMAMLEHRGRCRSLRPRRAHR